MTASKSAPREKAKHCKASRRAFRGAETPSSDRARWTLTSSSSIRPESHSATPASASICATCSFVGFAARSESTIASASLPRRTPERSSIASFPSQSERTCFPPAKQTTVASDWPRRPASTSQGELRPRARSSRIRHPPLLRTRVHAVQLPVRLSRSPKCGQPRGGATPYGRSGGSLRRRLAAAGRDETKVRHRRRRGCRLESRPRVRRR